MNDIIGKSISELQTPALIIYKHVLQRNVDQMTKRAQQFKVKLRSHFKTTKCLEAAFIQTNGTKCCMVVSTIPEAEMLCTNGYNDILYGVPLSASKIFRCAALTEKCSDFSVLIDNESIIEHLEKCKLNHGKIWSVFVKIDCNNGRAGIQYNDDKTVNFIEKLYKSPFISFKGIYAHCGNSYKANSIDNVQNVATETSHGILALVHKLKSNEIPCSVFGIGSTPSCSNPPSIMSQLTEWHPGNYVLYDVFQMRLGSCSFENMASFVLTRIIGHYPQYNHLLVDCGFTALSLHGGDDCYGKTPGSGYGLIANHPDLKLYSMHQEHGLIKPINELEKLDFSSFPIGMILKIYPNHSCATCGMHRVIFVADNHDKIIEQWYPVSGW